VKQGTQSARPASVSMKLRPRRKNQGLLLMQMDDYR
jgi:hypothetical protein